MAPLKAGDASRLPTVAILPWGDVIEDFLEPLGFNARDYFDQSDGGWLFGYATALQRASWRPVIVWASREVARPECLTHAATGTTVWLVPGRSRVIARWNARTSVRRWLAAPVADLTEVLRREGCRAIITQEYEDPRFDQVVRIGRRLRIPVYASFQGGDRCGSWLEEMVRRRSIAASAGLIIPSAGERARVSASYARALPPIADIPNPIDLDAWQPIPRAEARHQLGIADDTFLVINHGRIDIARKGLDVLVEAWTALNGRPGIQLVMIGSGQDDKAFARLLDQRKPAALEWRRGYDTDRTRLRTWLSAADVYVSASRLEGMPVAPLEAMACGLPVVATDAKGLTDIIAGGEAHGGIRVSCGDPAALTAAIARLHADPGLRRRLSHAARKRVEDGYSLPAVSRALGALLDGPQQRSA